jgi:hypothetical protein
MKPIALILGAGSAAVVAAAAYVAVAQPPAAPAAPPPAPMTFFVTSAGLGDGANLGGLAGADAHCQKLAAAVGRGAATWRAYLSTQGANAVNARDRIGAGPWHNARGMLVGQSVAAIHGDTIEQARGGVIFGKFFSIDEKGQPVPGAGDQPNKHDILTGTQTDGRAFPAGDDRTCKNWTSNAEGSAMVGHHDKQGGGGGSWNAQHPSRGCSQPNLVATGGAGLFYCFAAS